MRGADHHGGAIYAAGGATLRVWSCRFSGNVAQYGGAVATTGARFLACRSTLFERGWADYGGGLYVSGLVQPPVLVGLTFRGNEITRSGAAIYVHSDGLPEWTVVRSSFLDNSWNWDAWHNSGTVVSVIGVDKTLFRNILVTGNHPAGSYSRALFASSPGSLDVINATVVGNQARTLAGYSATIQNSILWNNEWENTTVPATCRYSDIGDSAVCWDDASEAVFSTDPLFVDESGGDFHLLPGSPCIDAADGDVADASDLDRLGRYDDPSVANQGAGSPDYVDIGAYEYQP